MSLAQKGRTLSLEHRRKISETLIGNVPSLESRYKRKLAMTGKKKSQAHIDKTKKTSRSNFDELLYSAFGKTQHLRDWAIEYSINHGTLSNRAKRGKYTLEDALTIPVKKKAQNAQRNIEQ